LFKNSKNGKQNTKKANKIGESVFEPGLGFDEHSKNKTPVSGNAIPVLGVKPKRGRYVFWLFFKIGLCSAISFKRSRRELSIDVAEHRSTLKNYQIRTTPVLVSYPKQIYYSPKKRGLFLLKVFTRFIFLVKIYVSHFKKSCMSKYLTRVKNSPPG